MGKKKNKKFKSVKKQAVVSQPVVDLNKTAISEPETLVQTTKPAAPAPKRDEIAELNKKYQPIHRDVNKLMVILGILVCLFVIAGYFSTKTNHFAVIGDFFYKIGNFQTQ